MLSGAGGYYMIVLNILRWNTKEQMEKVLVEQIPNSQLTPLQFTINKNTNLNVKELKCQGKMYDVIRVEVSGNTITYYCVSDIKETQICNQLDALINQETSKRKDDIGQLAKDLFKLFSSIVYNNTPYLRSYFNTTTIFSKGVSLAFFLSNGHQLKIYPPPQ